MGCAYAILLPVEDGDGRGQGESSRVVRAQQSEPRSVLIVLVGREEAAPLGFPFFCQNATSKIFELINMRMSNEQLRFSRIRER